MRSNNFKSGLIKSGLAASVLLLAAGAAHAQSVNLTAGPINGVMPDGSSVPMWGYTCDATQPAQTIPDDFGLCIELRLVVHLLKITTATPAKVGARRLDALG